ncbi:hypothetical protein ACVBGC_04785 [Burkholderia stagnalis]
MTTPSPDIDHAPTRSDQDAASKPRVIPLPAHLRNIPSCEGVPDLFNTYLVNVGLILISGAALVGLFIWLGDPSFWNKGIVLFLIWLALLGTVVWALRIFIRGVRQAGAWFQVDSTGFRYGTGTRPQPAASNERCIEWREVVASPDHRCDVEYNSPSRVAMRGANFQFWRRVAREPAQVCKLPISLVGTDADDSIRCVRFKNRDDLLVAILCGLAHQGLRFNLNTFVAAGIHPETWRKLKTPWRSAVIYFSIVSALALFAFWIWRSSSLPFSLAILLVSLAYYFSEGRHDFSPELRHYPKGPIVFRIDDADATGGTAASVDESSR